MKFNSICEKTRLALLILSLAFTQSVQAMTESALSDRSHLLLGLSEVESQKIKVLSEINKEMFSYIEQQEIKEQLGDLFRAMPANINLTKQGKVRARTLQKGALASKKHDDKPSVEVRHKNLSQEAVILFGKLHSLTKEQFVSGLFNRLGKEKINQEIERDSQELWNLFEVLPVYLDLYLCDDSQIGSILRNNAVILGLKPEEIADFIGQLTPKARLRNFVKMLNAFEKAEARIVQKYQ